MKRVAIIAPDFAPSSMPPALRVRFFASHLTEFGWEPIVITTDPKHYEWAIDPANEQLLPSDLHVIRTGALPLRFTRRIGFGDLGIRSMWHHWRTLANLHHTQKIDALLIPIPPFVPMVLGRLAHMRFRVPYVLDYIDPWRTDYFQKIPKDQRPSKWRLAEWMATTLEPFAIKRASHIVGVSLGTTNLVLKNYPHLNKIGATEIPYGAPERDFEYLVAHPRENHVFDRDDGLLHLTYTGALTPPMYATLKALFAAFRHGLSVSPDLFSKTRLHFVGTSYAPNQTNLFQALPIAREYNLEDYVTERSQRISYLDATQLLLESHALLVIGSEAPHYTASKIFPYILSRRPILALFHEQSSVITILEETQAGRSVSFNADRPLSSQTEAIYQELLAMISQPAGWQPPTHWEAFEQYTARAMAQRLARVLDEVVSP